MYRWGIQSTMGETRRNGNLFVYVRGVCQNHITQSPLGNTEQDTRPLLHSELAGELADMVGSSSLGRQNLYQAEHLGTLASVLLIQSVR